MSIRRLKRMVNKPSRAHFTFDLQDLEEARRMMDRRDWIGAQRLLLELNRKAPNLEPILAPLALTHYHLNELPSYLEICIQLGRLTPDDPENQLALAHAYLMNGRLALAQLHFQKFLKRWPDHKEAGRAREPLAKLEPALEKILQEMDLPGENGLELAALHEESQILMEAGKYKEGIAKARELLRRKPNYAAPLNNISLMEFSLGEIPRAIATAERVLASAPENFQALGNLAHFLVATGREADARVYADRLKRVEKKDFDRWTKQAETCAALGDDAGVLDALAGLEERGSLEDYTLRPYVYHLAAVAHLRLGRENEARALWKKCFALSPAFSLAQENLADLNDPPGRRNGPWSHPVSFWLPPPLARDFSEEYLRAQERGEKAIEAAMKRFLSRYPHVPSLLPILFDRGAPGARDFAFLIAAFLRTPEAIALLREFGLGEKGTDVLRFKTLSRALNLTDENLVVLPVRPKDRSERTQLHIARVEYEPENQLPPEARAIYIEAFDALNNNQDGVLAERLLKQALALAPDSPQLLNNLAMAYVQQRRTKEAEKLIREIHQTYPDYLFARANMANRLIEQRKYDEALGLLDLIATWDRIHATEAAAVYNAWIHYCFMRGNREMALLWLSELERVMPEDANIKAWHSRLAERPRLPETQSLLSLLREKLGK